MSLARKIYRTAAAMGLRPALLLTVSRWADTHRRLSARASAEPGRWRTERAPYLREVMDCLSVTSRWERVVARFGSQLGKSESGNNWIGYIIERAPGPTLLVQPTLDLAKRFSRQRIETLIEETPVVKSL